MLSKFQSIISRIIIICVAIFTTVVFFQMGEFFTLNYLKIEPVLAILVFLCAIILVGGIGYLLFKIRDDDHNLNRLILISMLAIFFVIALIWLKITPDAQISDFGAFWSKAPDALNGKAIYAYDNDYFAKWAYQTGFLLYVMTVVKIFGLNVLAMQLLNVCYQVIILYLVYKLSMQIFNKVKVARLAVFILMIDLDWFALNTQADNQYLGMMLFLLTFYLLMKNKYWAYALAGVTLGVGSIVRPIGPVIIAGIVVYALLYLFITENKFSFAGIGKILITLVIYQLLFSATGMAIKSSGLNQYGLSNRDSEWKFVTGLDAYSAGSYDQGMVNRFNLEDSRAKMSVQEHKVIHENITELNATHGWFKLFWEKNRTLWAGRSMAVDFTEFEKFHSAKISNFVKLVAYMGSIVLIILSWIGSLSLFKTKLSNKIFLILLPLMAYAVVQLLIEVQGRYRLEFLPVIAILGGFGLYSIFKWVKSRLEKQDV